MSERGDGEKRKRRLKLKRRRSIINGEECLE